MKRLFFIGSVGVLLWCHAASATITNWAFLKHPPYFPNDSIGYSFSSERDTTYTHIYLETGEERSGLDPKSDIPLFSITMIDNYTGERWGETRGIMADEDPVDNAYRFSPGCPGLAPGLYIVTLSDADGTEVDTFRITPFLEPFRTVTGIVTPPPGAQAGFTSVTLSGRGTDASLSAWTDTTGSYSIGIDRTTIERTGGKLIARVDSRYNGYFASPPEYNLDCIVNNWNEVNFTFVTTSASVKGTVRSGGVSVENVRVVLLSPGRTLVTSTTSAGDGSFEISCPPGNYIVQAEGDLTAAGNLPPPEVYISLVDGSSETIDLQLPCDISVAGAVKQRGDGVLFLRIADSTNAMIERGAVMLFGHVPVKGEQVEPLTVIPFTEIGKPVQCNEIPAQKVVVAIELGGKVLDQYCRYLKFLSDKAGSPLLLDFSSVDTVHAAVTLYEKDCRAENDGLLTKIGRGRVSGSVVCGKEYIAAKITALLYNVATGSWIRVVPLREDCTFTIGNIPPGNFRVVAVIDKNGDKNPEEMAVCDSVLTFYDGEAYTDITISFTEKPIGTGSIAGMLSGINNLPEGLVVTVAAIPIDTTLPESDQLNETAFMMATRSNVQPSGTFTISDLPGGVYYVVGVAEETDAAIGSLAKPATAS